MDIFLVLANRIETVQMESTKMYTEKIAEHYHEPVA